MPMKLTKRAVEALQPTDKPYERRDSELKGFTVRVERGGTKTFWLRYPIAGRRSNRYRIGSYPNVSVEGARALATAAAGEVAKGIDPAVRKKAERAQAEKDRVSTLKAFLDDRFEAWALTHMKSGKEQLARIRSDFADQLDRPMHVLNPFMIEGIRQKWKREGMQPRSINRDMQRLQSVLSRAVEWGVLDRNPIKGLKPMKFDKAGRVRFLSAGEEKALRDSLVKREDHMRAERIRYNSWRVARHLDPMPEHGPMTDHLKPLVLLALNTGMRRGEMFSLKWSTVDFEAKVITVNAATAKSGQTRRIPLNLEALATLKAWRKRTTGEGFVFPASDGGRLHNVNKAWNGLLKLAEIKGFRFHDLRHHFASRLVQAGVDLNSVRELLGHAEISTSLIYAHLAPDNLRTAVEKVAVAS